MVEPVKRGRAILARPEDFTNCARMLGVGEAEFRAVCEVESRGHGFDGAGLPIILWERHHFDKQLRSIHELYGPGSKLDRARKAGLASPSRGGYPSNSGCYAKLNAARAIDEEAAFCSISIGLGQIMGFNHKAAGHASAAEMFLAACDSEGAQLKQMANFIKSKSLAKFLRAHDWAGFAQRYNGPAYKENNYDALLARAYGRWARKLATGAPDRGKAPDHHEERPPATIDAPPREVTAADLAAAGSRTIAGAQAVKNGVVTLGAAGALAGGAAVEADKPVDQLAKAPEALQSLADKASQAKDAASTLADVAQWAQTHWLLIVLALAGLSIVAALVIVWRGANRAIAARVDDANSGAHLGRLAP